jgi:hypothetical protein
MPVQAPVVARRSKAEPAIQRRAFALHPRIASLRLAMTATLGPAHEIVILPARETLKTITERDKLNAGPVGGRTAKRQSFWHMAGS